MLTSKSQRVWIIIVKPLCFTLGHHTVQLARHSAGDIGTGAREIGYMFKPVQAPSQRVDRRHLPAKSLSLHGAPPPHRATGYVRFYSLAHMLAERKNDALAGKTVCISVPETIATYAAQKSA